MLSYFLPEKESIWEMKKRVVHRRTTESGIRTETVRKLHDGIQKLKQAETTGVRYMQEWEERVMEQQAAREEGVAEGETVKLISLIRKKLQKGRNEAEIADALEESVSTVHKVKEILDTYEELSDLEIAGRLLSGFDN